jgi:carotenoid cleavage dioxygenase-like enzyme
MLHSFAFSGGRVSYANQFLRSRSYREAIEAGRISLGEFGTDPCRRLFSRIAAFFKPRLTDNANVSINNLGDEVVAFTETPLPIRFDLSTLETLGVFEYEGDVRGQLSIAHPHLDFVRQCSYSYVLKFGLRSEYRIFRASWDANRQSVICTIHADKPAYMHSIGMTERYLILAEFPLVVNPLHLKFSGRPFIQNYEWEKHRGVRFHVVDKDSGRVIATRETDACFSFHHVNAFEENGQVVVDLATYSDASVIDQLYLSRLRSDQPVTATARLTRFRMDVSGSHEVRKQVLADTRIELPRIDYRCHAGRPYRVVYGAGNGRSGDFIDNIVKVNVERAFEKYASAQICPE